MSRRSFLALAAFGATAFLLRKQAHATPTPINFDFQGIEIPDLISDLADFRPVRAVLPQSGGRLSKSEALALAERLNRSEFGGWFDDPRHSIRDVVAIWDHESAGLNPRAINMTGRDGDFGGAWGLGQVLATTAASYGYNDPETLLDAETGARVSMIHMRRFWDDLTQFLKKQPTNAQWIKSYNAGAKGVAINGVDPILYYAAIVSRRALI